MNAARRTSGFTLIELLMVITILGIIAALTVPALKNFGKASLGISATRQLLDDVARARQLAISQRTTVYMVFVPGSFWINMSTAGKALPGATNMCDKQFTGYIFVSKGKLGDQPGQHRPAYLAAPQNLPDGSFIATNKFNLPNTFYQIPQWELDYHQSPPAYGVSIFGFCITNTLPFPVETNYETNVFLPYIAFNYLGQLTFDGSTLAPRDEYIPLAQGSIIDARDPNTKALQLAAPDVKEIPPGNSTNISYNLIHIDALTGRAVQEYYKMK